MPLRHVQHPERQPPSRLPVDPAVGERQMRAYVDAAMARSDYEAAAVAAGRLVNLCRDSGRLAKALTVAEQTADYTRQAGLPTAPPAKP